MRKIVYFILLFVLLTGCSVLRKSDRGKATTANGRFVLTEGIVRNNLTSGNFTVNKMEVIINSGDMRERFTASLKFEFPGKYLLSIRSIGNLEIGRVFLTPDTVLINDRINRIVFYGEPENFSRKFGLNYDLLPVIFGDYVNDDRQQDSKILCADGKAEIDGFIKGLKLLYTVDCKNHKVISAEQNNGVSNIAETTYDNFLTVDDILIPAIINIKHIKSGSTIEIHIGKVVRSIDSPVEFVPGNKYKFKELK